MNEQRNNLDQEFKRYLQILRPYLGQLVDQDVIEICNDWILRLSNCCEEEKGTRNKYIFALCYQLARGVLDEPFLKHPIKEELPSISEGFDSDTSTEVEYLVIDAEETNTKLIFNNKKPVVSETEYLSQDNEIVSDNRIGSSRDFDSKNQMISCEEKQSQPSHKQTILCYTCPQTNTYKEDGFDGEYEYRANNLIMKLREIKKQNVLLHKELMALKEESRTKCGGESFEESLIIKVDNSINKKIDSSATLKSLKTKLQEVEETRNALIETIGGLQDQLDHFHETKRHEIEEIESKHKMEIVKIKSSMKGESKDMYDEKLEELKQHYETKINKIQSNHKSEIQALKKEKEEITNLKSNVVIEKDAEIAALKLQLEDQTTNLHSILNKFIEKPNEVLGSESMKMKALELEKRLSRMEKSKIKNARLYESKLAYLQREKHLAECSLQLQLVRQRAQVVNEIAEENQSELSTALEKLETRYKDIVANVQATAIQRRIQDQMTLESILQAACGTQDAYISTNHSQVSGKTVPVNSKNQKDGNQSYDSEISGLLRNKDGNIGSKTFGDDSVIHGFCLDGERLGELFEKVYIPQRDTGDGPLMKL